MTVTPMPSELAQLDELELRSLAASWRLRAGYGHPDALGIVHALDAERQRRSQSAQGQHVMADFPMPGRSWWQSVF